MEFLKNHYEKVLLSIVLLALAVAAALLPIKLNSIRQSINGYFTPPPPPQPVKPLNVTNLQEVIQTLKSPPTLKLAGSHNLFNPVEWQKTPDGRFIKIESGKEVGPAALQITNIYPLRFIIRFDAVRGTGDNVRYRFGVTQEGNANPNLRRELFRLVQPGDQNDIFRLKRVLGPPEQPTQFILELADSKEEVTVTPEKPYERIVGYAADMRYPPENRSFNNVRVGTRLTFAGDTYVVVSITQDDLTVSSVATTKRWTIQYKAAP